MKENKPPRKAARSSAREKFLRVQATHIVSMLPDDTGEALQVLAYARHLVERFIAESAPRDRLNLLMEE